MIFQIKQHIANRKQYQYIVKYWYIWDIDIFWISNRAHYLKHVFIQTICFIMERLGARVWHFMQIIWIRYRFETCAIPPHRDHIFHIVIWIWHSVIFHRQTAFIKHANILIYNSNVMGVIPSNNRRWVCLKLTSLQAHSNWPYCESICDVYPALIVRLKPT